MDLVGADRLDLVISRLKHEVLDQKSSYYFDTILVENRINGLQTKVMRGTLSYENENVTDNKVTEALLWIIREFAEVDLKEEMLREQGTFQHIPPYHRYAVNRDTQIEKFEMDFLLPEDENQKIHFYYLYGDARQEMHSLAERLNHERNGRTLSAINFSETRRGKEREVPEIKVQNRKNPVLLRIHILKGLLEQFVGPVNNMRGLQKKNLKDLLVSPKIAALGPDEAVFILVTLDDHNWSKAVPSVLQDLFEAFCKVSLPPEAPHFYFCFGIEYKKSNQKVRNEVTSAIQNRKYGEALEELLPVNIEDIAAWFTLHRLLVPPGLETEDITATLFPNRQTVDMLDVETELLRLINRHNKGLVLKKINRG